MHKPAHQTKHVRRVLRSNGRVPPGLSGLHDRQLPSSRPPHALTQPRVTRGSHTQHTHTHKKKCTHHNLLRRILLPLWPLSQPQPPTPPLAVILRRSSSQNGARMHTSSCRLIRPAHTSVIQSVRLCGSSRRRGHPLLPSVRRIMILLRARASIKCILYCDYVSDGMGRYTNGMTIKVVRASLLYAIEYTLMLHFVKCVV